MQGIIAHDRAPIGVPPWTAAFLALCLFVLYAPAARPFARYGLPGPEGSLAAAVFVLACTAIAFALLWRRLPPRIGRALERPWLALVLVVLAAIATLAFYPMADALKLQMRGSDQDDCVISGVRHLVLGLHPYVELTYFNHPCSPGPGMLALYAPFVLLDLYALGAPLAIGAAALVLRAWSGNWQVPNVVVALICSSLATWELMIAGTDLILLGCAIAIVAALLPEVAAGQRWGGLIALALLGGLCASTRINFVPLFAMFALFVAFEWRAGGAVFLLVGSLVALVPGGLVYAWDPATFTPLHLMGKSRWILGDVQAWSTALTLAVGAAATLQLYRRRITVPAAAFHCLLTPLLILTAMELVRRGGNVARLNGSYYLVPVIPLACLNAALLWRERQRRLSGFRGAGPAA